MGDHTIFHRIKICPSKKSCFYKKLREAQKTLQEQQMQGTLDEKVMKSLQEISQEASQYPLMMELMEKERAISVLIDDLNKIIFKPLSEVYDIEG